MPKAQKPRVSHKSTSLPSLTTTRADCHAQVEGFAGAPYKKLNTDAEFIAAKSSVACTSATRDIVPSTRAVVSEPKAQPRAISTARPVLEDEKDSDIVYCDGACKGNGQPGSTAGIGVWWGHNDPRNISERCPGDQTNNRAELIAIVRILETTPRLKRRLLIKTDSNYSIQCVTSWIFKWMRNGFRASDGKPVKNRALIKYLAVLLHVRRQTSQRVELKHVRGHVGIEGNEAADQLANLGATKPMVPERDWGSLEEKVLQSLNPVKPVGVTDDDLKAYADCLLDDEELAELSDTAQQSRPGHLENAKAAPHSLTPRTNVVGHITVTPGVGTAVRHTSKSSSGGVTPNAAPCIRSVPPKKSTTAISKGEMELQQIFASCLLDDTELARVGEDGMFDSDF